MTSNITSPFMRCVLIAALLLVLCIWGGSARTAPGAASTLSAKGWEILKIIKVTRTTAPPSDLFRPPSLKPGFQRWQVFFEVKNASDTSQSVDSPTPEIFLSHRGTRYVAIDVLWEGTLPTEMQITGGRVMTRLSIGGGETATLSPVFMVPANLPEADVQLHFLGTAPITAGEAGSDSAPPSAVKAPGPAVPTTASTGTVVPARAGAERTEVLRTEGPEPYRIYAGPALDRSQVARLRVAGKGVSMLSINGGAPPSGEIEMLPGGHVLTVSIRDRLMFLRFEASAGSNYDVVIEPGGPGVLDTDTKVHVESRLDVRQMGKWGYFLKDVHGDYRAITSEDCKIIRLFGGTGLVPLFCRKLDSVFGYVASDPMWQTYDMGLLILDERGIPISGQHSQLVPSDYTGGFPRTPSGHYYALEGQDLILAFGTDLLYAVNDSGKYSNLLGMSALEAEQLTGPVRDLARQLAATGVTKLDEVRLHFATAKGGPLVGRIQGHGKGKQKLSIQVGSLP